MPGSGFRAVAAVVAHDEGAQRLRPSARACAARRGFGIVGWRSPAPRRGGGEAREQRRRLPDRGERLEPVQMEGVVDLAVEGLVRGAREDLRPEPAPIRWSIRRRAGREGSRRPSRLETKWLASNQRARADRRSSTCARTAPSRRGPRVPRWRRNRRAFRPCRTTNPRACGPPSRHPVVDRSQPPWKGRRTRPTTRTVWRNGRISHGRLLSNESCNINSRRIVRRFEGKTRTPFRKSGGSGRLREECSRMAEQKRKRRLTWRSLRASCRPTSPTIPCPPQELPTLIEQVPRGPPPVVPVASRARQK